MRLLRLALALVVGLWMAGAGCMLGCENMVTVAAAHETGPPSGHSEESGSSANAPVIVASGGSCASMKSHDCCAKQRAQHAPKPAAQIAPKTSTRSTSHRITAVASGVAELSGTSSMMMDCPLAVNATAALSKAKPDLASHSLAATAGDNLPNDLANSRTQSIALSSPLRLPNRGHTYLRCCVFLI